MTLRTAALILVGAVLIARPCRAQTDETSFQNVVVKPGDTLRVSLPPERLRVFGAA